MLRSAFVYFDSWLGRSPVAATVLSETPTRYRVRFEADAFGGSIRAGDIDVVHKHSVVFLLGTTLPSRPRLAAR